MATAPPADPDKDSRVDISHLRALAIDDTSTFEIDDALSVEELDGGRWRLWVHVADPSRYLSVGDPIEQEARRRTSSCYLPTGTIPMMPRSLAGGAFSLRPNVCSCALSFGALIDADGTFSLDELTITPSVVAASYLQLSQAATLEDHLRLVHQCCDCHPVVGMRRASHIR